MTHDVNPGGTTTFRTRLVRDSRKAAITSITWSDNGVLWSVACVHTSCRGPHKKPIVRGAFWSKEEAEEWLDLHRELHRGSDPAVVRRRMKTRQTVRRMDAVLAINQVRDYMVCRCTHKNGSHSSYAEYDFVGLGMGRCGMDGCNCQRFAGMGEWTRFAFVLALRDLCNQTLEEAKHERSSTV